MKRKLHGIFHAMLMTPPPTHTLFIFVRASEDNTSLLFLLFYSSQKPHLLSALAAVDLSLIYLTTTSEDTLGEEIGRRLCPAVVSLCFISVIHPSLFLQVDQIIQVSMVALRLMVPCLVILCAEFSCIIWDVLLIQQCMLTLGHWLWMFTVPQQKRGNCEGMLAPHAFERPNVNVLKNC